MSALPYNIANMPTFEQCSAVVAAYIAENRYGEALGCAAENQKAHGFCQHKLMDRAKEIAATDSARFKDMSDPPFLREAYMASQANECAQRVEITRLEALVARQREALEAIIDHGVMRDVKWTGMTARDIASAALEDHTQ